MSATTPGLEAGRTASAAAVSTALEPLWTGAPIEVVVRAVFPRAAYLHVWSDRHPRLVVVVTADGVQQPGAAVLTDSSSTRPLRGIVERQIGRIGANALEIGPLRVVVGRWWDPTPALGRIDPVRLATRIRQLEALREAHAADDDRLRDDGAALARALLDRDLSGALSHAGRLLGYGPGLTPAGDDLLAGVVAGLHLFARAVGAHDHADLAAGLGELLEPRAQSLTTAVSASLLAHAARAQVTGEVAAVLRAIARDDDVAGPAARLFAVGATSGHQLAHGIVLAGRVASTAMAVERQTA